MKKWIYGRLFEQERQLNNFLEIFSSQQLVLHETSVKENIKV